MGQASEIEWTDATWNPVTGCTKIGPGATTAMPSGSPNAGGASTDIPTSRASTCALAVEAGAAAALEEAADDLRELDERPVPQGRRPRIHRPGLRRDGGRRLARLSGSDQASSLMRNYVRKRYGGGPVPRHIWLGVSVEDAAHTCRIEHLRQINSDARFISFEPLLGPIGDVDLEGIAWAIVGGESGPRARPMDEWARQLRDHASRATSRSSSSNGAAHGRSLAGGYWKAKNGTGSHGRSCQMTS